MKKRKNYRAFLSSFAFIFPAILVVGVLLLYPVVTSVFYSFTSKHLIKASYKWVWLDNYKKILSDPEFLSAFLTSIKWTVCSLLGQILVGFTAALALERIKRGKGVYRTLLIIPWAFPSIVIALSWKWILNGVYGFVPNLLVKLGICETIPQFFSSAGMVFGTLVFINIWFGAPLIMVNVLSALQTVPKDQYEAAQILGYTKAQTFFKIILPQVIKRILPSITNEVITLVKDTSLSFTLSVAEMFTIAKALAASQTNMIPFVAAGIFYYVFNLIVAVVMEWIEKKLDYYR